MSTGAHRLAVQSALEEIRNVSPDVINTFIFNPNGEIQAKDDETSSLTARHAAETFNALAEKAGAIGGLESATFFCSHRRVNISRINDSYLATVASKESDQKYTETIARVLIPTVLRIVDNLHPVAEQESTTQQTEPEFLNSLPTDAEESSTNQTNQPKPVEPEPDTAQPEPELDYEPSLTEPSATQFIIEHLGGLLVPPDTVRIDNAVILEWKDLYGDREINEVDVETLNGETTRCKLKPIKDSKLEGKGIIQMPQKTQVTLKTSTGELVMVKPVIE